jgi:hypothetical protein
MIAKNEKMSKKIKGINGQISFILLMKFTGMSQQLAQWMECALCMNSATRFFIYCGHGHSFCRICRMKLYPRCCPLCRTSSILYSKVVDHSRNSIILEYYDDFIKEIRGGKIIDCDVRDSDRIWREACIVGHDTTSVRVHFYGWEKKWDEQHQIHIDNIRPHHSMVPRWFDTLSLGAVVEYRIAPPFQPVRWHRGEIIMIDSTRRFCRIRNDITHAMIKIRWSRHHLTPLGTHTPRILTA